MASLGVDSIAKLARGGAKPTTSSGLSFFNTGTALATDKPLAGVTSQTSATAAKACWGS
jgi:fructose transport system substrate-binding protein